MQSLSDIAVHLMRSIIALTVSKLASVLVALHDAGRHEWAQLLTKLDLSRQQQRQLLSAREQLLSALDTVGSERWNIIVQLGQAALELGKVSTLV